MSTVRRLDTQGQPDRGRRRRHHRAAEARRAVEWCGDGSPGPPVRCDLNPVRGGAALRAVGPDRRRVQRRRCVGVGHDPAGPGRGGCGESRTAGLHRPRRARAPCSAERRWSRPEAPRHQQRRPAPRRRGECGAFAASVLLPHELVDQHIPAAGPSVYDIRDLNAASSASRAAACVRAAQRLRSPGHVVLLDYDGTVQFAPAQGLPPVRKRSDQSGVPVIQDALGFRTAKGRTKAVRSTSSGTPTPLLPSFRAAPVTVRNGLHAVRTSHAGVRPAGPAAGRRRRRRCGCAPRPWPAAVPRSNGMALGC
ncbi:MAG: hypothetical protein JWN08_3260 [Frankiales bacterium]|nr:hypothetical protein [Frankiales bacterium]